MSYCTKCGMIGGHSVSCENGYAKITCSDSSDSVSYGGRCDNCGRLLTSVVCPCQLEETKFKEWSREWNNPVGFYCEGCGLYIMMDQVEPHACVLPLGVNYIPPVGNYFPYGDNPIKQNEIIINMLKELTEKIGKLLNEEEESEY